MKKMLLLLFGLYATLLVAQNVNYSQNLFDMLMRDDCFGSWNYLHQYNDSIVPEAKLMYKHKMSVYMNRLDSAAFYYEKMIQECPIFFPNEHIKLAGINVVLDFYIKSGNLEKVLEVCKMTEETIMKPPFDQDADWQKMQLLNLSQLEESVKNELKIARPKVTIDNNVKNEGVDIEKGVVISASVECNGVPVDAIVDTGCQFPLFVTKSVADRCNFTKIVSASDSILVNGVLTHAATVLVDSIKIGSVLLENIKALVVYDDYLSLYPDSVRLDDQQVAKYDSVFSKINFLMGLPLLNMLGSLEFDWEKNRMYVDVKDNIPKNDKVPDMFSLNNHLYVHLLINSKDFVGYFDSGNSVSAISINSSFYKKYQKDIELDPEVKGKKERLYGIRLLAPDATHQFVTNPKIFLGSKQIFLVKEDVNVWFGSPLIENQNSEDGVIGLSLIKNCGKKVKLDFVNMQISME